MHPETAERRTRLSQRRRSRLCLFRIVFADSGRPLRRWGALGLFAIRNQVLTLIAIKHTDLPILFRPFMKIVKAFLRCAENPVLAADVREDMHELLRIRTRHVIGISVPFNILPF